MIYTVYAYMNTMPVYISVKDVAINYRLMIPFHGKRALVVAFQIAEGMFRTLSLYGHTYVIFSINMISSDEVMESFYRTLTVIEH